MQLCRIHLTSIIGRVRAARGEPCGLATNAGGGRKNLCLGRKNTLPFGFAFFNIPRPDFRPIHRNQLQRVDHRSLCRQQADKTTAGGSSAQAPADTDRASNNPATILSFMIIPLLSWQHNPVAGRHRGVHRVATPRKDIAAMVPGSVSSDLFRSTKARAGPDVSIVSIFISATVSAGLQGGRAGFETFQTGHFEHFGRFVHTFGDAHTAHFQRKGHVLDDGHVRPDGRGAEPGIGERPRHRQVHRPFRLVSAPGACRLAWDSARFMIGPKITLTSGVRPSRIPSGDPG